VLLWCLANSRSRPEETTDEARGIVSVADQLHNDPRPKPTDTLEGIVERVTRGAGAERGHPSIWRAIATLDAIQQRVQGTGDATHALRRNARTEA